METDLVVLITRARLRIMRNERRHKAWLSIFVIMNKIPGIVWRERQDGIAANLAADFQRPPDI